MQRTALKCRIAGIASKIRIAGVSGVASEIRIAGVSGIAAVPASATSSRQRHVDVRERVGFFFSTDFFSALVKRCAHGVARLVEQFTDNRALLFAERFHPLAPFGDAAAFSEIFYTDSFERSLVWRCVNLAKRLIAQLFERVHGTRESLNR